MYGIFFPLCVITIILLLRVRQGTNTERTLLPVAALMLVIATTHIIIDFVRAFNAYVLHPDEGPKNIALYYSNFADPTFVVKTTLYWIQTMLGDSVIIWRCYVVYDRHYRVVLFPSTLFAAAFAFGIIILRTFTHFVRGATVYETAHKFITTFFVLTMVINIYCTSLISWRIYSTGRFLPAFGNLVPVIVVIIESGAIYTSNLIIFLSAFLSHSNAQTIPLDLLTPVVGIVFCLIILQVRYHFGMRSGNRSSGRRDVFQSTSHLGQSTYPNSPRVIDIRTHTERPFSEDTNIELGMAGKGVVANDPV